MKASAASAKHRPRRPHKRPKPHARPFCGMPKVTMRSDLRPEEDNEPCHVYLLVHRHEARFKIGISVAPTVRLSVLPEANQIDHEQSLTLCLPSKHRALRIEKILHKALDDFRLDVHSSLGVPWDGGTEWFHLECFMHAVDLLQRLPKGRTQETLRLQRLDGDAVDESLYLWKSRSDERRLRQEVLARENVIQMRQIWSAFQAIVPYCSWSWRPATGAGTDALGRVTPTQAERVVIRGLADLWEPEALGSRYALGFSKTWMFKTGKGRQGEGLRSMVSLIRFSAEQPKDLELHLIERQSMRDWPGAALMLRIWDEIVGG
jgi:hypothetical protein